MTDSLSWDEVSTNELTPYEIALAQAYPGAMRVDSSGLGYVKRGFIDRLRSGRISMPTQKLISRNGWRELP